MEILGTAENRFSVFERHRIVKVFDASGFPYANVVITGKIEYRGVLAQELREELKTATRIEKKNWLESFLTNRISGSDLHSFNIIGLDTVADPLTSSYVFCSVTFIKQITNGFTFYPGDIMRLNLSDYFPAENRKYPVRFRFGFQSEIDLEIIIPPAWQFSVNHIKDSLDTPFGTYFQNWSFEKNILLIKEKYRLYGNDVDVSEYSHFKKFLDMILKICNKEVLLKRE
jgi:hypothetical protein